MISAEPVELPHHMHSGIDWSSLPLKSLQDDTAYCHLIKERGYVLKSIQEPAFEIKDIFLAPYFQLGEFWFLWGDIATMHFTVH